jgi:hypothetical protein
MIFGLYGEDKSCKTTLALTFPKPLVHMELDIGGFDRAIYRFNGDYQSGLIKHEMYPMPLQGLIDVTKLQVRPNKIITGMKELWYHFLINYIKHLDEDIATIVIDTGTLLWEVTCTAYLQEKQEIQFDPTGKLLPNEKLRVSLLPIEYREPNIRMRGIIYQAKAHGKHLVLTHHSKDEYGPVLQKDGSIAEARTGKRERAGFATLGDSADVIVRAYWQKSTKDSEGKEIPGAPYCQVELAEVKELEGMVFKEPSFDKIDRTIKMLKGIQ